MVWTGNLFENNTARSGSAGMELNQCSGDIRQSTFFKNRVRFPRRPRICDSLQALVLETLMRSLFMVQVEETIKELAGRACQNAASNGSTWQRQAFRPCCLTAN